MIGLTKPPQRARAKKALASAPPAPALELSPAELALLHAFRQIDGAYQRQLSLIMASMAKDFPRRVSTALRLVGGAS